MRFSTMAVAAAAAGSAAAQMMNQTICDKYTTALLTNNTAANQFTLVSLLVKTAVLGNFTGPGSPNPTLPGSMVMVPGILADGMVNGTAVSLAQYFNGSLLSTNVNGKASSVNFLDGQSNTTMLTAMPMFIGATTSMQYTLFLHLVQYFGVLLGCSGYGTDGYSAYGGSNNQYMVHKFMDLSEAEFTYFNTQVGLAAASFGASDADVATAAGALNMLFGYRCAPAVSVVPDSSENYQVMCIGDGCPLATDAVSSCSGQAAVPGYTPTEAAVATPALTSVAIMTSEMTTTNSAGMTVVSTVLSTNTNVVTVSTAGNFAARQTAAAGLLAGVAAVGALVL